MSAMSNRLDINIQQVLRNIGYGADCNPPVRIASLVEEYVENVNQLIEPSYSYFIRDVKSVQSDYVVIEGWIIFKSEIIARLLEQCEKVAVFALTIGERLEEMAGRLAEDGLGVQAAVLDAIGSDAAERVADFVQGRIGEDARTQGLCISQRFSPGYCDWDVSQQKMVFQAMKGDSAGIRLTEGNLMLPCKSISGIIGIGPCGEVDSHNPCKTCDKSNNCPWKR